MSTRANITLTTRQGKFKFQANGSAYPSNVMKSILTFAISVVSRNAYFKKVGGIGYYDNPDGYELGNFIAQMDLQLGHVGNPTYFYDIDFTFGIIKVFESKRRWVNAPNDWQAKGWVNLEQNSKGRWGYYTEIKGKEIYNRFVLDLVDLTNVTEIVLKPKEISIAEAI
jgi:hypothetical protein